MTDSIKAIVSEMRDENRIRCLADGDYFSEFDVEEWANRLEELDATAAPVVVGEDMVSRALDAQPFTDKDCANRAWQYLSSLDDQQARKFMRAALTDALAGD